MKLEKCTVIKHGDAYSEKIRYGFCPECSELEVEFTSKDTAIRGSGMIKYTVASYKYECKNCGCIWSENEIVNKRIKIDDNEADFLKALLIIFLVVTLLAITAVATLAVIKFAYSIVGCLW